MAGTSIGVLSGARNALSGAGSMKVYQESLAEQQRKETENYASKKWGTVLSRGGKMPNKDGFIINRKFHLWKW